MDLIARIVILFMSASTLLPTLPASKENLGDFWITGEKSPAGEEGPADQRIWDWDWKEPRCFGSTARHPQPILSRLDTV